jgi:hypothetical protein
LFLGCSLDGLQWYLERLRLIPSTVEHYALVDVENRPGWLTIADVLALRYKVKVLAFDRFRIPLVEALQQLEKQVAAQRPSSGVRQKAEELPMSHVRLEQIGPFASLELDFQSRWTVLLGGNGVGKSTILRAIAAALAGKRASRQASLLNVNAPSGRIEIKTARQTAVLFIGRLTQRGAALHKVECSPERPFELEGIPLIGFPALRAFREGGAAPKVSTSPTAMAEDLLPLAEGSIDRRLSDLKSWLIDLDYKIQASKPKPTSYNELWDYFFHALDRLAQGIKLGPGRIDREKKDVYVETADGVVPIEAVSQGTSSLMCWVGTLTQRLFDVYGAPGKPGKPQKEPWTGAALVLIDEIDTHMHPQWQRKLPGALSELFPKTQFIVTTHSPLLVAGLAPESIVVLGRDGGQVEVERLTPERDIRGLRADQILASWLFGLSSTVSPKVEDDLRKYARAVVNPDATPAEKAEAQRLADELRLRPIAREETDEAREAARLIREWMTSRIDSMDPEARRKLLEEVDLQLLQTRGGLKRK